MHAVHRWRRPHSMNARKCHMDSLVRAKACRTAWHYPRNLKWTLASRTTCYFHGQNLISTFLTPQYVEAIRSAKRSGLFIASAHAVGGVAAFNDIGLAVVTRILRQKYLRRHQRTA